MTEKMIRSGTSHLAGTAFALASCAVVCALLCAPFCERLEAQTHKAVKPENVVRAVGVYEWTGDMAKPTASRLIPVSLYIDDRLEDAAVYLARPVPMALLTGNVYELDQTGIPVGNLDLAYARHFEANDAATTNYDDGWFGYGKFVPPAPPVKSTLKASKTLPVINAMDDDDDRPHFSAKSAAPGSGGAATPAPGTAASTTSNAPPDDPDRPTLHRSASSGSTSDPTASSGSGSSGSAPADDPDRPTLRRRTPTEAKAAQAQANQASVTDVGSLNDDPNRPTLHRGKPTGTVVDVDLPKLSGLPGDQDLHQMIAVSDPKDRPVHDFSRTWDDDAEHQDILAKMQAAARAQLKIYEAANAPTPPAAVAAPTPAKPANRMRRAPATQDAPPPPPAPEPLLDEQLKAYTLSYGGAATYVYSAHTDGLGPMLRFVTIVAQTNMQGEPEIAIKNVTDATHLDRTPRMKLVDVVDAEASNRASLLFELRAQNSRQFALYRVIGGRAEQIFLTGSTR